MADVASSVAVVAVIGAPNAGKSTLVNRVVGAKVSIVTHKVQTTRSPVRGIAIRGGAQLVLVDTPGLFTPKRRLDRAMVSAAWGQAMDADLVVHLVDAAAEARVAAGRGSPADHASAADVRTITERLRGGGRIADLVLNKVDAMPRPLLLGVAQHLHASQAYGKVFMISALDGAGVEDLADHFAANAKLGPWLYPEDQTADSSERVLAAEITREQVMLRLHDELPYAATVETDAFAERRDGSVRIEQTVLVERESQRKIAIGERAQTIKAIGQAARAELQVVLGRQVHLFLHVKVREGWSEERTRYDALGLSFDS